jgi:hypothetical protein
MHRTIIDIFTENRRLDGAAGRIARAAFLLGVLGLSSSIVLAGRNEGNLARFYSAYLTSFAFLLSLSLGALFFVLIQHVTGAGWSVVVRRIGEAVAANSLLMAALSIPLVFGMSHLYPWTDLHHVAGDPILQGKRAWLNVPFFVIRLGIYFLAWTGLSLWFLRRSTEQDRTGEVRLTARMQKASAPGLVLYAITVSLAAFDLLMSLDPHWYSTIFGVYYFSGGVVGFFALLPVITILLQRSGRLARAITPEHYHDMGKLVFAFTVFWAYIAFSQYMLIWYANLPEETGWMLRRLSGGWAGVGWLLLFGHFVIPFFVLLPRFVKRSRKLLIVPALWVLAMHWVDIYWLVMPEALAGQSRASLRPVDLTCLIGLGGLYVGCLALWLRGRSIVPEKDPRLAESLSFENA